MATALEMQTREMPANIEAEQALLGAALGDNAYFNMASGHVRPADFADALHGRLWQAIGTTIDGGRQANPITLRGLVAGDADLAARGGHAYLAKLVTVAAVPAMIPDLVHSVREASAARRIIAEWDEGADILSAGWSGKVEAVAAGLQDVLDAARLDATDRRPIASAGAAALVALDGLGEGKPVGVPTGLVALDRIIGGLWKGQLVVLAGSTGMGKSAAAQGCAWAAAEHGTVAFFSREMDHRQLGQRMLAWVSGVPLYRIAHNRLHPEELERLHQGAAALKDTPIEIDDNRTGTVADMRRACLDLRRKGKLSLVVVDYIQLLQSADRSDNRAAEVAAITRSLKVLAGELDVPVLALSQLNRQVNARDNKRPVLSDLRESGAIEQDADVVLFCYRPGYYREMERPTRKSGENPETWKMRYAEWEADVRQMDDQAEIVVAKQRQGPANRSAMVRFEREVARYVDLPGGQPEQQEAMGI